MSALPHRLLTAEEFAALPHDGLRLELIRGEIIAQPPALADHGQLVAHMCVYLGQHIDEYALGNLYLLTGFQLSHDPDIVLGPDIAFIRESRGPKEDHPFWSQIVPDLVFMVASVFERREQTSEKVQMWLDAGVRLVWVAYPTARAIEVHRKGQPVTTLHDDDTLDGYDVVPGFSIAVSKVFG